MILKDGEVIAILDWSGFMVGDPMAGLGSIRLGSAVILNLAVPGHNRQGVPAQVRWMGHKASYGVRGFGVQFDELSQPIHAFVTGATSRASG